MSIGGIIFIVFICCLAASVIYHLGWRAGLNDGIAEGRYLEAYRRTEEMEEKQ